MKKSENKHAWNKRSFKFGAASTAFTVVFIVVIVLINLLAGVLVEKFPVNIDLTSEKLYEISDESRDFIQNMTDDVTITILVPENDFDTVLARIMKKYDQLSDKITFRSVDTTLNPTYVQKYQQSGASLSSYSIIVESDKRYKILSATDLYQYSQNGQSVAGLKAEQKLTSALMYVTNDEIPGFYTTTGHDESDASGLASLAADNNYTAGTINLMTEDIDESAQLIAIVNPQRDFTDAEIEKLDAFMRLGNKGVFVFLSPSRPSMPILESYMAEWGLAANRDIVIDTEYSWGIPYYPIAAYSEHDITTSLMSRNSYVIAPYTSSVERLFDEKGDYSTYDLLSSAASSYAKDLSTGEELDDFNKAEGDAVGPFTLAAGARKITSGQNKVVYSNMLVFGSEQLASDSALMTSSIANSQLLASAMTYIHGKSDLVSIATKYYDDSTMTLTSVEGNFFGILFMIVIPLALIAAGIVVFVRRRHL